MAERLLAHPKVKPVWNSVVTDVLGANQNKVTGVRVRHVRDHTETDRSCAGVFVAIGHAPNTEIFRGQLAMNEASGNSGLIKMCASLWSAAGQGPGGTRRFD